MEPRPDCPAQHFQDAAPIDTRADVIKVRLDDARGHFRFQIVFAPSDFRAAAEHTEVDELAA
ncbi:MAG: hypothetical protein ABSE08_06110 [Syntrophobacteraceae bacterium]